MLFGKLLSILGVAVASCRVVAAAPTEVNERSLKKRGATFTQACTSDDLAAIAGSVTELKDMLDVAISRTYDLSNWLTDLNNGQHRDIHSEPKLLQSTARTFEAIFGPLWFGTSEQSKNAAALARIQYIQDFENRFLTGLQTFWNNPAFEIYCSDDWLQNVAPDFSISQNPFVYWDYRPTSSNTVARDFTASAGICRDNPSHYAWVNPTVENNPQGPKPRTSIMTLCQSRVGTWTNRYVNGRTLRSLATKQYAPGEAELDEFQGSTYTSAFLHELSHAASIVGKTYMDDKACTVPGKRGSAYGWECISDLAQVDPEQAINNADSWTYYITALFFQKNDWSTGVSNPL